ncbi:hypothetical protein MIND_00300200 [Mycena indigotica]|uniref:F-box domain-containing protein n=1 Tax=Mycena indigotica TaxID=2126181 RepID=A0A8H6W840_9AGAR|nr:uncharacterized protein MIND_00300200 [Mycena indigotica]KAF7309299.1 hypothetical protein MIND_00300200 [Mycena indigotica]
MSMSSRPAPFPGPHLPYELLVQIFTSCLPLHRRIEPDPKTAPMVLTQVCATWRDLALSMPELWRAIRLYLHETNSDTMVALLELWLSRSAQLTVSLCIRSYVSGPIPSGLQAALASCSLRWERIELDFRLHLSHGIPRIRGPFPCLRALAIRVDEEDYPALLCASHSGCVDFPLLSALGLCDERSLTKDPDLRLPSSLVALSLNRHDELFEPWDACLALVHCFPHLRHLTLSHIPPYFEQDKCVGTITRLSRLETLHLQGDPHFLNFLVIPSLKSFQCLVMRDDQAAPVTAFLIRSGCKLEYFSIALDFMLTSSCAGCIHAIPPTSLRVLEVIFRAKRRQHDPALDPLAHLSFLNLAALFPHLQVLRVFDEDETGQGQRLYSPFLAKLHGRLYPSLRRAEYHTGRPTPHNIALAELDSRVAESLMRNGLNLRLSNVGQRWPWAWTHDDDDSDTDYAPIPLGGEDRWFKATTLRVFRPFSCDS